MRMLVRSGAGVFSKVLVCAASLYLGGCVGGPDRAEQSQPLTSADAAGQNLLPGRWTFVSSDVRPDNAYAIKGNEIDLSFNGYFSWDGTWAQGYRGYTFEQPVAVVEGGHYRFSLAVSNANTPIPTVLRASLSGAGAEQQKSLSGDGTIDFEFVVTSDPGAAPAVSLTAHPVLGQIGPIQGTGIGVTTYDVTASLISLP